MALTLLSSTKEFFSVAVDEALKERGLKTFPYARDYLVSLLDRHLDVTTLYDDVDERGRKVRESFAEMYLKAAQIEIASERIEMFQRLGDRSLYISGFFADSLSRKLVSLSYCADIGKQSYEYISSHVEDDLVAKLYRDLSTRFEKYMDILSFISTKSKMVSEQNILRLFEAYQETGSDYAKDQLVEKGLFPGSQITNIKKVQ